MIFGLLSSVVKPVDRLSNVPMQRKGEGKQGGVKSGEFKNVDFVVKLVIQQGLAEGLLLSISILRSFFNHLCSIYSEVNLEMEIYFGVVGYFCNFELVQAISAISCFFWAIFAVYPLIKG